MIGSDVRSADPPPSTVEEAGESHDETALGETPSGHEKEELPVNEQLPEASLPRNSTFLRKISR